jgi:hypothetical protein
MPDEETGGTAQDLGEQAIEIAKRRQAAAVDVLHLLESQLDNTVGSHP